MIRASGPGIRFGLESIAGGLPAPRRASLRSLRDPADGSLIDQAIVIFLPGPASYTGEDCAEFQCHGSRAVVAALLRCLDALPGWRMAEPGEFTRRAFDNGRLDLTEVEGVADLISAETDAQRRQALRQMDGGLSERAAGWRDQLLRARALVEADLDFADEDDVPDSVAAEVGDLVAAVERQVSEVLAASAHGERIRDGFEVALLGPPNAGKSTLLNTLSRRDVAIVTDVPGTTRDTLEVHLDLGGLPLTLIDTAGLRETDEVVEAEGIRRTRRRAGTADLVLWLDETGRAPPDDIVSAGPPVWCVQTKIDRIAASASQAAGSPDGTSGPAFQLSAATGAGIDTLLGALTAHLLSLAPTTPALVTRARQRLCLERLQAALVSAGGDDLPLEIRAEHLRRGTDALASLTGRVGVEDILGEIFSSFCIGK
ncbi:tRNA uridine-5-carboxymethylaminomethyl(34) synthesis GTPase MnmE [Methylobrevis pamukkalensis]|uniref:tRNA uridine-5-carboxymethylaminomethyl(34) synthesis GTPase MnmE n=1 Tax=Methylobrevis pamukkalensis TaxID=1439726 RepID=UPI00315B2072